MQFHSDASLRSALVNCRVMLINDVEDTESKPNETWGRAIFVILLVLGSCIFLFFLAVNLYIKHTGTDVSFQSSDGRWSSREALIKGLTFEKVIIPEYVTYKLCTPNAVSIQRVTSKPNFLTLENMFNNYDEIKWSIPLKEEIIPDTNFDWIKYSECEKGLDEDVIKREAEKFLYNLQHNQALQRTSR